MGRLLLLTFLIFNIHANEAEAPKAAPAVTPDIILDAKSPEESIDFTSIRDLIKKDGLEGELKRKEEAKKLNQELAKKAEKDRYSIPNAGDYWPFFFEYWLVKNAPVLKWDFHKPEFGVEDSYAQFLSAQGYYETKFKILFLDSTELFRMSFFGRNGEVVHLLSLPFIRTLDLSKVEISLLLFEDFLRLKRGYLKTKLENKDLNLHLGTNYVGKAFPRTVFDKVFKDANSLLFTKGFSFQEQFEVTKDMDQQLKSDMKIWNTYYTLLSKIDQLSKTNLLYKKYAEMFPSPEMQMNWLQPKSKYP